MRLEYLPIVFGAIVALAGLGLIADAWMPDRPAGQSRERRRRTRAERHRGGEAFVGIAVMMLGAALIGRDTWAFSVWLAGAACVFIIIGALLNRRYMGEQLNNRGAARRDPTTDQKPGMPERTPPRGKLRVR